MPKEGLEKPQGTQTAARGLRVLSALAEVGKPLRLRDLIDQTGIAKSAAHRILAELVRHDLVVRTPDNWYCVGPAMVALAAKVLHDDALRVMARPLLERLASITTETITLHIPSGDGRVCIDAVESIHPIRRVVALGQTLPLHVGPTGKVILALLPAAEQERILASSGFDAASVERVRGQMRHLVEHGYIAAEGDRIAGVGGFSFALLKDDRPVASVTISGPATRWSLQAMSAALPAVRESCVDIQPWTASIVRGTASHVVADKEEGLDV